MPYLYSTLTNSINISEYSAPQGGVPRKMKTVKVNGGANIADKHLITPAGAVTEVSDDDLSFLKQNKMFNRMIDRGFIKVETKETKVEKVVSDMTGRDESAPLVPDDFTEETQGAKPSKQSKKGK